MPKRGEKMSEEQKAKMRAGAERARAERLADKQLPPERAPAPVEYVPAVAEPDDEEMPFDRFDDETEALIADGLITRAEVEQIRLDAQVKAAAERKAATKKSLLAKFVDAERSRTGLVPQDEMRRKWLDELVDVQIVLPYLKSPNSNTINHPDPIRIDGRMFANGRNYRVTRAQAQTLYDMMGKARKHHAQTLGESPAYYDANRGAFSYMGGVPAGGSYLGSRIMEQRGTA